MGGFKKVYKPRKGLAAGGHHKRDGAAKRDNCANGGFYTAPTSGQSVDSAKDVTISWNNQCLSPAPKYVDIYLYAPSKNDSMIQAFDSADYSKGTLSTTFDPNWWGLDTSIQLQLTIVSHGTPQFMSSYAAGPIFTATYDPSEAGSAKASSGSPSIAHRVKNILEGLSGGAIAAAVIFPLLAVGGIVAFFYIRAQRKKRETKTKRFSTAVDQRMSTISTDWKAISGAGANAAIRNSMAVRGSSDRPTSMFENKAGIGALETSEQEVPQMEEMRRARQSVFTQGERQSRISFAPDTRMSYAEKENPRLPSAVRGLNTRSFHRATSYEEDSPDRDLNMSPTQTNGPKLLQPGEIAARASSENDRDFQREVLQMPAMTMMRTDKSGDFVLPQQLESPAPSYSTFSEPATNGPAMPPQAHAAGHTPMNGGMMPMSPTMATGPALSPDALLRAYAAGRPLASSPVPTTTSSSTNGGMRILYQNDIAPISPSVAPSFPQPHHYPASSSTLAPGDNNPFRKSMAGTVVTGERASNVYTESMYSAGAYEHGEESDEDAYGDHHTGYHGHAQ